MWDENLSDGLLPEEGFSDEELSFKKLKLQLQKHLAKKPTDASDVLAIVALAMVDYEKAVSRKRGILADNALRWVMNTEIPFGKLPGHSFMVDAIYHQFPTGVGNHSANERACWNHFISCCEKEKVDVEWLGQTRGPEFVTWFHTYVEPCYSINKIETPITG